ncbi:MAG: hypothetical protein J6X22_09505 [Muribaculaceae bacterium]|nr:hypothetical protein [Muribaculaceae bacterium]
MKKLVLLFAAVFAMTFVSCETKPASDASASASSAPVSTENVQSAPEASTSAVASEEVSENKDAAAPAEGEQASAEKKEEAKPEA